MKNKSKRVFSKETIIVIGHRDQDIYLSTSSEMAKEAVSVDKLKSQITKLAKALAVVVEDIRNVGKFSLEEVTFNVEVSCTGSVSLLGTGGTAGTKGAIQLKFCKPTINV
jgi:hypothetical protein